MLSKDDYLACPKCNQSNTVEFWDRHTKAEAGIKDGDPYISAGLDKATHDEVESYYYCPVCNSEVDGVNLKSN